MLGRMQDWPLLMHKVIDFAAVQFPDQQVASRTVEGPMHYTNYREIRQRALKVAKLPDAERFDALTKPPQRQLAQRKPQPTPERLTDADAYANGWRAGVEACVRLAKEKGNYALATKMRALKDQAPTPYDLTQALLAHSPAPPRALPEE